ncbi:hypothetical protein ACJX0J_028165, partial [Zea mays]
VNSAVHNTENILDYVHSFKVWSGSPYDYSQLRVLEQLSVFSWHINCGILIHRGHFLVETDQLPFLLGRQVIYLASCLTFLPAFDIWREMIVYREGWNCCQDAEEDDGDAVVLVDRRALLQLLGQAHISWAWIIQWLATPCIIWDLHLIFGATKRMQRDGFASWMEMILAIGGLHISTPLDLTAAATINRDKILGLGVLSVIWIEVCIEGCEKIVNYFLS